MDASYRKAIYCPKTEDHGKPKLLLLLHKDKITVHCHEHQWIDIKLLQGGEPINFENVAVQCIDVPKNTHLDLEKIPTIAIGEFETKRDKRVKHN